MRKITGFTLIELLVTVLIATILMTVAVPSFRDFLLNNRLTVATNDFVTAVNLARSEAAKRRVTVLLSALDQGNAANAWAKGWRVWIDRNANGAYDAGVDEQLLAPRALEGNITFSSTHGQFQYRPSGRVSPAADTFRICDDRSQETGRQLQMNGIGRLAITKITCS